MAVEMMDKETFWKEAITLYNEIYERRNKILEEWKAQGIHADRVPYEFVDMDDLYERLLAVVEEFQTNYSYYLPGGPACLSISRLSGKAFSVSLAAICQMIKKDYFKSIWRTYEERTGNQINNTLYNILEQAFEVEDILPDNWEQMKDSTKRYKKVLIEEAGIYRGLTDKVIQLFIYYRKYFEHCGVEGMFEWLKDPYQHSSNIDMETKDISTLRSIYDEVGDFDDKIKKILRQLNSVYSYFESGDFDIDDLEDSLKIAEASQYLGFDIMTVLPSRKTLKRLYIELLNKVTPVRFRRILAKKPMGYKVKLPDNTFMEAHGLRSIDYGVHVIGGVSYQVVPHVSLDLDTVSSWPYDRFVIVKEKYAAYKSHKEFYVYTDVFRIGVGSRFYHNGTFLGYVWFSKIPEGVPLKINEQVLEPQRCVFAEPTIRYKWNFDYKRYELYIHLPEVKLYFKEYKNREIKIVCRDSINVYNTVLDGKGIGRIMQADFKIEEPMPMTTIIDICEKGEAGKAVIHTLSKELPEVIFFNKVNKTIVSPGIYNFGECDYLLFTIYDESDFVYNTDAVEVKQKGSIGLYNVYAITWLDKTKPLQFAIKEEFAWTIKTPIVLYLREPFISSGDEEDVIYEKHSIGDIKYELVTNLDDREMMKAYLIVNSESDDLIEIRLDSLIQMDKNGPMLTGQKLLEHCGRLADFIGILTFSLVYKGQMLSAKKVKIVPEFSIKPLCHIYKEGDAVQCEVTSSHPCFIGKDSGEPVYYENIEMGSALVTVKDGAIEPLELAKDVYIPLLGNITFRCTPHVFAVRGVREGSICEITSVNYYDLDKMMLAMLCYEKEPARVICQNGQIIELLAGSPLRYLALKELLKYISDDNFRITVKQGSLEYKFNVRWPMKLYRFEKCGQEGETMSFIIAYDGPCSGCFNIRAVDDAGHLLYETYIYGKGKKVEETIKIEPSAFKDSNSEFIYIRCYRVYGNDREQVGDSIRSENPKRSMISNKKMTSLDYDIESLRADIRKIAYLAQCFCSKEILLGSERHE